MLSALNVAGAVFHENLSKQQAMATSSPQPFPNKKMYPMLRGMGVQIITVTSSVSSFNLSSCPLTDDDSESQASKSSVTRLLGIQI